MRCATKGFSPEGRRSEGIIKAAGAGKRRCWWIQNPKSRIQNRKPPCPSTKPWFLRLFKA
jgi:hypothetical protein